MRWDLSGISVSVMLMYPQFKCLDSSESKFLHARAWVCHSFKGGILFVE